MGCGKKMGEYGNAQRRDKVRFGIAGLWGSDPPAGRCKNEHEQAKSNGRLFGPLASLVQLISLVSTVPRLRRARFRPTFGYAMFSSINYTTQKRTLAPSTGPATAEDINPPPPRLRRTSIRRPRASPSRAVEAPEPQVVVVRPPRARRVEDRVGGVDAGHPFFTSRAAPVRVVLEREPSVGRADLRLGCRRCHSKRRVMRRRARKVDGARRPRF